MKNVFKNTILLYKQDCKLVISAIFTSLPPQPGRYQIYLLGLEVKGLGTTGIGLSISKIWHQRSFKPNSTYLSALIWLLVAFFLHQVLHVSGSSQAVLLTLNMCSKCMATVRTTPCDGLWKSPVEITFSLQSNNLTYCTTLACRSEFFSFIFFYQKCEKI